MTSREATAEVFVTAFKALSKVERELVFEKIVQDPDLREDMIDIGIALQRESEPSLPYESVRQELHKAGRL